MIRNLPAGYQTYVGCGIQLFSDFDLEAIHSSTLEVMGKIGILIESEKALDIFEQAGAQVDVALKLRSFVEDVEVEFGVRK